LIVEDEEHHKYIIEIERQEVKSFVHKSCFNTSRLIVDQIGAGNDYLNIKKVFHISLLYFKVGDSPIYHGKTIVKEIITGEKLSIHLEDERTGEIYNAMEVFPEYIFISIPQFNDKLEREIDEWLYVMKHEEVLSKFTSPYMRKVEERLDILKMTTEARDEYLNYKKQLFTYKDAINTSYDKGKLEGIEEFIKQMAIKMLKQGLSLDLIKQLTSLPDNILNRLKADL
jgi:predicted transposase/invertase (TIGR01784 family)